MCSLDEEYQKRNRHERAQGIKVVSYYVIFYKCIWYFFLENPHKFLDTKLQKEIGFINIVSIVMEVRLTARSALTSYQTYLNKSK